MIFPQPLEVREICPERCFKASQLGVWSPICSKRLQGIVKLAAALESGRFVARDIGKFHFILGVRRFIEREQVPRASEGGAARASVASFRFPVRRRNEKGKGAKNRRRLPTCPREVFWLPINRARGSSSSSASRNSPRELSSLEFKQPAIWRI
jgi:hypothetical protein